MKKVHFIGIGGSGISAVCGIAAQLGYEVSGCETIQEHKHNALTRALQEQGIPIYLERNVDHLVGCDLVCVSPAVFDVHPEHVELTHARVLGIPVMITEEFMARELMQDKTVISVSGTKGKSTTTALVSEFLEYALKDPTAYVGASIAHWGKNYRVGKSDLFVCEADEYFHKLRLYSPTVAVITNVSFDHPEFFKTPDAYFREFSDYIAKIPPQGTLILNIDSQQCRELYSLSSKYPFKTITYGVAPDADIRLQEIRSENLATEFSFIYNSTEYSASTLLLGEHNVLNALAVFALGLVLSVDFEVFSKFIAQFKGISRRLEYKGMYRGSPIYDDYAHHPIAIQYVLKAMRQKYPTRRIWAIFQPHTYSRTIELLPDFAQSFDLADEVIVVPIYASREQGSEWERKVSHEDLVNAIQTSSFSGRVRAVSSLVDAVEILKRELGENDVVANMGAGTNWTIAKELVSI
jgi:UDP-N-acetylmuramate--alanine ligase